MAAARPIKMRKRKPTDAEMEAVAANPEAYYPPIQYKTDVGTPIYAPTKRKKKDIFSIKRAIGTKRKYKADLEDIRRFFE